MVFQAKATGQYTQRKRKVKMCGYAGIYWFLNYLTDLSQFFLAKTREPLSHHSPSTTSLPA